MPQSTQYKVRSTKYSVRFFHPRPRPHSSTLPLAVFTLLTLLTLLTFPLFLLTASAADFSAQLTTLAAKCDELGLIEQAAITRAWPIQRHPGRQYLFLPATSD